MIAWAPEDRPDDAQIGAVFDDFEELAFGGQLSELGEITRRGSSYISVKPHWAARAIRLKGAIYDAEFGVGRWLALASAERSSAALATIYRDTESALSAAASSMDRQADRELNRILHRIWHLIRPQLEQQALSRSGLTVAIGLDGSRWILFP